MTGDTWNKERKTRVFINRFTIVFVVGWVNDNPSSVIRQIGFGWVWCHSDAW